MTTQQLELEAPLVTAKALLDEADNSRHGQSHRILNHLLKHPNEDIPAVSLHRIGSGKPDGFLASFSRRISYLRFLGYNVIKSRDERQADGSRWTHYKLII